MFFCFLGRVPRHLFSLRAPEAAYRPLMRVETKQPCIALVMQMAERKSLFTAYVHAANYTPVPTYIIAYMYVHTYMHRHITHTCIVHHDV